MQEEIVAYLKNLRCEIIAAFEAFEPLARFQRTNWDHHTGGGGEISELRNGQHFEKAAVNFSAVSGEKFPMSDGEGPFFATGVSLITHMVNPHMPTVHMNVRFIKTQKRFWFAGGYDLTPMGFPYDEDTTHFHGVARKVLGEALYNDFSQKAKEYFTIRHYDRERGVGGIFFDHYNTGNFEQDHALWTGVGNTFLDAIIPIYKKRLSTPYTQADKAHQLKKRAHYVEFNLLYDRGTKFGFLSGGNPRAILCSMPPLAAW